MSKGKTGFTVIAAMTGAAVLILVVAAFVLLLVIPSSRLDKKRDNVEQTYSQLSLPAGLQLASKAPLGDPIDSPDDAGWQYQYGTSANFGSLSQDFKTGLAAQGFTIGQIEGDQDDSTDFTAMSRSKDLRLEVTFSPGIVTIVARQLPHE